MTNNTQNSEKGIKEKFGQAMKNNDQNEVQSLLREMFINAVELKINTSVCQQDDPEQIETTINLLEGDIKTTIHPNFISNMKDVKSFHQEQVNKAEQIVEKNISTLRSMTEAVLDLLTT